jgi:hypothetical protein
MPPQKKTEKAVPLNLEVEVIEQHCHPGCGTSTTSSACTCPVSATTTGSLFTAKTIA